MRNKIVCVKKHRCFDIGQIYYYESILEDYYKSILEDRRYFIVFYGREIDGYGSRAFNEDTFKEFFQSILEYRNQKIDKILE